MIVILTTICVGEDGDRHCAEDACGGRPPSSTCSSLLFEMTLKITALTNINGNMDASGRDTSRWLIQQLLPKLHWLLISAQDCSLLDTRWKFSLLEKFHIITNEPIWSLIWLVSIIAVFCYFSVLWIPPLTQISVVVWWIVIDAANR